MCLKHMAKFNENKTELSTYWNEKHYVRGTLKVPRTFSRFPPFLDKKYTRFD